MCFSMFSCHFCMKGFSFLFTFMIICPRSNYVWTFFFLCAHIKSLYKHNHPLFLIRFIQFNAQANTKKKWKKNKINKKKEWKPWQSQWKIKYNILQHKKTLSFVAERNGGCLLFQGHWMEKLLCLFYRKWLTACLSFKDISEEKG